MAARKRSKVQREQDLTKITKFYLRGMTQADIAGQMEVTQQQVAYDLKTVHERLLASTLIDLGTRKAIELSKIDQLEREYWTAWARSCQERTVQTTERITGERPRDRAGIRKELRDGNHKFLQGVQWCIAQRCKILGLEAPLQIDIDATVRPDHGLELKRLPHEQLVKLREVVQSLEGPPAGGPGPVAEPPGN